jgi:hypothetical protein
MVVTLFVSSLEITCLLQETHDTGRLRKVLKVHIKSLFPSIWFQEPLDQVSARVNVIERNLSWQGWR